MALAIIMVWYVCIGALAAAGSMYLSHRFVPAKHEATLYGPFLIAGRRRLKSSPGRGGGKT